VTTQQYTVRSNRQRPRIWIEGARLLSAGFTNETHYTFEIVKDSLYLIRCAKGAPKGARTGARKVSGAPARPIIDITGKSCAPFETGDAVEILYVDGLIVISREVKS
jgi:hypothetical protein